MRGGSGRLRRLCQRLHRKKSNPHPRRPSLPRGRRVGGAGSASRDRRTGWPRTDPVRGLGKGRALHRFLAAGPGGKRAWPSPNGRCPRFMQYRWLYTNTLSILHRITGVMLSVGFFVLVYWLSATAGGPERYARAHRLPRLARGPGRALRRAGVLLLSPVERRAAPVLRHGRRLRACDRAYAAAAPCRSPRSCSRSSPGSRSATRSGAAHEPQESARPRARLRFRERRIGALVCAARNRRWRSCCSDPGSCLRSPASAASRTSRPRRGCARP